MRTLLPVILFLVGSSFHLMGQIEPIDNHLPVGYNNSNAYPRGNFFFNIDGGFPTSSAPIWGWVRAAASPATSLPPLSLHPITGQIIPSDFSTVSGVETYVIEVTASFTATLPDTPTPSITKEYTLMKVATPHEPVCPAREYAIVIDQSGSMRFPASKWAVVRNGVSRFLRTITPLLDPAADRLTVIFFNGNSANVRVPATSFGAGWLATDGQIQDRLFNDPPIISPNNSTPLGSGLREALDNFFLTNIDGEYINSPNVILFTDGIQNVTPRVIEPAMEMIEPAGPSLINLNDAGYNDLKIMTIGVGAGTYAADLLNKLSKPDEEYVQADLITSTEMNVFLDRTIPTSLADCTPRIVDYKEGTIEGSGNVQIEKFYVNRFTNQLVARLTVHEGDLFTARLFKDGNALPLPADIENNTAVFSVDFPFFFPDSLLRHDEGEWEVHFTGSNNAVYDLVAIVDDDYVKTDLHLGDGNKFYTGDVIPVELRVEFGDAPLDGVKAEAIMLRPGDDLGDLAAETAVDSVSLIAPENISRIGQAKLENLMEDSAFIENLRKERLIISLTPDGNGNYVGKFQGNEPGSERYDQNEVTGTYRVYVRSTGSSGLGPFTDWVTKCAFVDFARTKDIDLQESVTSIGKLIGDEQRYLLTIKPVNQFERKIGPAQEGRIKVFLDNENSKASPIKDNLDGSYSTVITMPRGQMTSAAVHVIDLEEPVKVIEIGKRKRRFGVSFHAGTTRPINLRDLPNTTSLMGEFDLVYRFSRRFSTELVGGYYTFDRDFEIVGGNLFGIYRITSGGPWGTNLGIGAGLFQPEGEDTTWGTGAKVGFSRYFNDRWEVALQATYFRLPEPEYEFGTGAVLIKYFF